MNYKFLHPTTGRCEQSTFRRATFDYSFECFAKMPTFFIVFFIVTVSLFPVGNTSGSAGDFVDSGHLVWTTIGITARSESLFPFKTPISCVGFIYLFIYFYIPPYIFDVINNEHSLVEKNFDEQPHLFLCLTFLSFATKTIKTLGDKETLWPQEGMGNQAGGSNNDNRQNNNKEQKRTMREGTEYPSYILYVKDYNAYTGN